jgi:hypothetical protein
LLSISSYRTGYLLNPQKRACSSIPNPAGFCKHKLIRLCLGEGLADLLAILCFFGWLGNQAPALNWMKKTQNTHCGLAQQNGFGPAFFHRMLRLVKGMAEPNTSC